MAEGGFRFEGGMGVEGRPELGELRTGFTGVVRAGTKEELAELLEKYPQRDSRGRLVWLLTSGMAVELATGFKREHHDLDVVVMDERNFSEWEILGTDNVTPGQYWADMRFNARFLERTAGAASFRVGGRNYNVEVVHPTIIMTQKLSNAFGRNPRSKDIDDAAFVIRWWERGQEGNANWIKIVQASLDALPENQQAITENRINSYVPIVAPRD